MAQDPEQANDFSLTKTVELNDGTKIPVVGLGTYVIQRTSQYMNAGMKDQDTGDEDKLIVNAVTHALKTGYVHIDSAQAYDTERLLMEGIKAAGKERKDVFITSKLVGTEKDPSKVGPLIEKSVELLGGYIDLFLMHAPTTNDKGSDIIGRYKVMMDYHKQGKLKSIGVSNFNDTHLRLFDKAGLTLPSVNQIEIHPFLVEKKIVDYCNEKNIKIEAYSPIAQAKKLDDPVLADIAKKYNKTSAQVMLRWGLQKGFIILPKSTTPKRIEDNVKLFDFKLSDDDMKKLDELSKAYFRVCWNVINTVEWDESLFVKQ